MGGYKESQEIVTTLVIDVGINIVGVYCVEDAKYTSYMGSEIPAAIQRIQDADEVVTYNGEFCDLELGKFAGIDGALPIKGIHTDMQRMI